MIKVFENFGNAEKKSAVKGILEGSLATLKKIKANVEKILRKVEDSVQKIEDSLAEAKSAFAKLEDTSSKLDDALDTPEWEKTSRGLIREAKGYLNTAQAASEEASNALKLIESNLASSKEELKRAREETDKVNKENASGLDSLKRDIERVSEEIEDLVGEIEDKKNVSSSKNREVSRAAASAKGSFDSQEASIKEAKNAAGTTSSSSAVRGSAITGFELKPGMTFKSAQEAVETEILNLRKVLVDDQKKLSEAEEKLTWLREEQRRFEGIGSPTP